MSTLYYEDFAPGDRWEFPRFTIPAEEIIAFARRYDPQPYHTDPDAAAKSVFGGLVASGVHTITTMIRLQHDALMHRTAAAAGIGLDRVRFPQAAHADTPYLGSIEVLETSKRESERPWGLVVFFLRIHDEAGTDVLSFENRVLIWQRP